MNSNNFKIGLQWHTKQLNEYWGEKGAGERSGSPSCMTLRIQNLGNMGIMNCLVGDLRTLVTVFNYSF